MILHLKCRPTDGIHYQDPKFQQQYMCLGHKISTLRTSMGISQRQLADVVGISRAYLSKLECGYGISGVSIEVVFKIAYCLNVSTSQFTSSYARL